MDDYAEEFLSQKEGAAKSAVKRLTHKIEEEMHKLTINAEDWYATRLTFVMPRSALIATIQ